MDVVFNSNKFFCWINQALITCVSRIICVIETLVPSKFSDKIRILRSHEVVFYNVIGLTFFNSLGGLLTILTQVKLANVMGASHYGVYSYCLAIGEVAFNFWTIVALALLIGVIYLLFRPGYKPKSEALDLKGMQTAK